MENYKNKEDLKRLLIYLHLYLGDNRNKIVLELVRKTKKTTKEMVDEYFSKNQISVDDYITIIDDNYPRDLYDPEIAPFVIKKAKIIS